MKIERSGKLKINVDLGHYSYADSIILADRVKKILVFIILLFP